MKMTLEQKLAHGEHPVLRWCMDHVVVQTAPAWNIKISKARAAVALDRAVRNESSSTESVYAHRGLLFI